MVTKVSQGVTTVIAGNCGVSLARARNGMRAPVPIPLDVLDGEGGCFRFPTFAADVRALREQPPATSQRAACRALPASPADETPTSPSRRARPRSKIRRMRAAAEEAPQAGAIGVSMRLYYEAAAAVAIEELIEVCRSLAKYRGLHVTHMRDEADRMTDSLEETFAIGRALAHSARGASRPTAAR
jgi:N-acyl-D-amino-acid deacylase